MGDFDISLFNGSYTNAIADVASRMQQLKNDPAQPQAEVAQNARPQNAPADVADKIARLVKNFPVDKGSVTLDDLKDVKRAGLPKALKAAYAEATALVKAAQESLSAVGKLTGAELADAIRLHGEGKSLQELKDQLQKDYDSLAGKGDSITDDERETLVQLEKNLSNVKNLQESFEARLVSAPQATRTEAVKNWNAVEKALADQENLSAKLLEMINATKDAATKDMLETLMLRADSRASELSSLVLQMHALAEEDAKELAADAPVREEIKNRSAESLMSDMSVAMHDNLEAAVVLVSDDNLGVNAMVDTLEKLDNNTAPLPEKAKDGMPSQADLLGQFGEVEKAFTKLRTAKPAKKGAPAKNPNPGRMDAPLARNIRTGLERIKNRAEVTARRKRAELHDRIFGGAHETLSNIRKTYFWGQIAAKSPKMLAFESAVDNLLTSSENLAREASPDNVKAFRKAKENFLDITGQDGKDSKNAQDFKKELDKILKNQSKEEKNKFSGKLAENVRTLPQEVLALDFQFYAAVMSNIDDQVDYLLKIFALDHKDKDGHDLFVDELEQMERYSSRMTEKTFESTFKQNGVSGADIKHLILNQPLSGVIEARVYGDDAPAEMFETECLDEFIVDKKELGKGGANTAWLVTYKLSDGRTEERVFKDEISDYAGSNTLNLSRGAWKSTHQMVKINYAVAETANILGTPNAVTKVKAAMCDGYYGLLMNVAPGQSAHDLVGSVPRNYSRSRDLTDLSPAAGMLAVIQKYGYDPNDDDQRKFVGSHAKGTTELVWNDLVTGQGDRHRGNYFIDKDEDGKAVVTGIDNDMCFPAYKTGLLTYHLEGKNLEKFKNALLARYDGNGEKTDEEKIAEILKDAGINGARNSLDITITDKTPAIIRAALRKGLGVWSGAALPAYISRTMHDNLLDKAKQNQLKDLWKKTLDEASYKASVNRLKEIVSYVDNMAPEKVLDDEEWGRPEVIRDLTANPVDSLPQPQNRKDVDKDARDISGGLLGRDFGDFFQNVKE